jgi:DNA processing protein
MSRDEARLRLALTMLEPAARNGSSSSAERDIAITATRLEKTGVGVLIRGDDEDYPRALEALRNPPRILFYRGKLALAREPAVGMCGSREASPEGLAAARACGRAVARAGLAVISGYARGVDTETHLGALEVGGSTVIVLADGIEHFRIKRVFREAFDPDRVLVLSQFPPRQTWNAGAAMTRNGVIAALGRALVVIEANEAGGTLDAGLQGLALGRPVLALEFRSGPRPGNELLFARGAHRVAGRTDLLRAVESLSDPTVNIRDQLRLALP